MTGDLVWNDHIANGNTWIILFKYDDCNGAIVLCLLQLVLITCFKSSLMLKPLNLHKTLGTLRLFSFTSNMTFLSTQR